MMWTSPKTPARTHYMFQMVQWSKTKALKEALNALVLKVSTNSEWKGPLKYQEDALVHLIHVH
jgi:hypothetical protein